MTQETLTVRMDRSDISIPWGFTLRAFGSDIVVDTVEKGGLAEKAAIAPNDTVIQFADCKQPMLTLNYVKEIMNQPKLELRFVLCRFITSHISLPWNLTDQKNTIVVDKVNPPTYRSFKSAKSYKESIQSSDETEASVPKVISLGYKPSSFNTSTPPSAYDKQDNQNSFRSQQHEEVSSSFMKQTTPGMVDGRLPSSFTSDTGYDADFNHSVNYNRTDRVTAEVKNQSGQNSYALNEVAPVPIQYQFKRYEPSTAPVNHSNSFLKSNYHFQPGPKPFSHSSHIRNLSPTASVKYLQSKPASTSYAYETPAEEYVRKTGGLFGTDLNLSKPVPYLASETRRAIAEKETGFARATSPAQSESFKRISRAVGTPVS